MLMLSDIWIILIGIIIVTPQYVIIGILLVIVVQGLRNSGGNDGNSSIDKSGKDHRQAL